ncbi:DEAD-box ATP-dependent RNA helicase CshA [Ascidiaceihabitans donghaensis]|uniref:DEAD-box ATP-dependent RNA helicase CshA n=1 Tax=Ascidiaceihabitans donghaensis TaxID=1510460 RepID=A0A2R8B9T9_9RHOB|nr:DEAD-box ATP-dependent RNA helicase CshA [Ascidiaceihabitans donghaensis]
MVTIGKPIDPIQGRIKRLFARFDPIRKPVPLKQALADALQQRGYETLTPVQEAVTEDHLEGADLLVSAQTGSGKTVGFGLALGNTLLGEDESFDRAGPPLALIIAPTRELAMQVKRELAWLYEKAGVIMASCVGGMDMRDERRSLARGAHIVVATPGRLRDHIMKNVIDLSAIRAVVLDEADEMLDLGFREDLEFILGECPEDRRTLMFSATVPKAIANLAKSYQRDSVRVTTVAEAKQHTDIEYHAMNVANHDGENAIINILRFYEAPNAIVFCNTRAMVNRVTTRLSNRGFSVVALSGELSQAERTHALQAMRDGRARVCVATDVAARGIDLPGLDLVVHAELPNNHETMLHRSGRTGRAGRKGVSALIVTGKVRRKAERILHMAKVSAEWGNAPSADAVREKDQARLLDDPMWSNPVEDNEAEMVAKLMEHFSPEQLSAAFMRLYAQRVSAPEELSAAGDNKAPKARAPFGPSKWFSVSSGRNQGAEVRRLLPILCNAGDITKDDIGAIRIQNDETFVEIQESSVAGFKAALGADMKVEGGLTVSELANAPAAAKSPRPPFKGKPKGDGAGRNFDKSKPQRDYKPREDKPRESYKPRDEKPRESYKPREDDKPRTSSAPIDYNDAPAPKPRKPKPSAAKPTGTAAHPASKRFTKPKSTMDRAREDGAVSERKPRGDKFAKPGAKPKGKFEGKPKGAKPGGKPSGGKNLAPKVGKPNSKKNKARRAAAEGGGKPPRR